MLCLKYFLKLTKQKSSKNSENPNKNCCEISNIFIFLSSKFQVFKYIVGVYDENSKNLCETGQYVDKKRCREAIDKIFEKHTYVYDSSSTLYFSKPIDTEIEYILPKNLRVTIRFQSIIGIDDVAEMRTFLNKTLNQYSINQNIYSFIGNGETYEVANYDSEEAELYQKYGLVIRHGNSKGVQFINNNTEIVLTMDYKKSIFYKGNANFMEIVETCKNNALSIDQITELYKNVVLQVKHQQKEYFKFNGFVKENDELKVEYFKDQSKYSLDDLIIVPDQKVSTEKLAKLKINNKTKILSVSERYDAIKDQFRKMEFDNPITKAFGIYTPSQMVTKNFHQFPLPSIKSGDGNQITPNEDGTFQIDKYYETASIKNLYIFDCSNNWGTFLKEYLQTMSINFSNIELKQPPQNINNFNKWRKLFKKIDVTEEDYVIVITKNQKIHDLLEFLKMKTGIKIQHIWGKGAHIDCIPQIVHQINDDAGGTNWKVDYKSEKLNLNSTTRNIIIIAVDVRRDSNKNNLNKLINKVSCVGIASNSEKNLFNFNASFFYQKAGQEIIKSKPGAPDLFYEKVIEILKAFSCDKEADIIYTRDGVSETEYIAVVEHEISSIKKAAEEYFGNRDIYEQFHLITHHVKAEHGTAKTLMITILMNEIGAEMEDIQSFLLALCNLHQLNCGPIRLLAPIFLADEIAYKGQRMLAVYENFIPKKEQIEFNGMNYKELTTAITKRINDNNLPQQQPRSAS